MANESFYCFKVTFATFTQHVSQSSLHLQVSVYLVGQYDSPTYEDESTYSGVHNIVLQNY